VVNLFRRLSAEPGGLTVGLLALLEHADRSVLNALLREAGFSAQAETDPTVTFPLPGAPPQAGAITLPGLRLVVITQNPGEPLDLENLPPAEGEVLAVTLTGQPVSGAHTLAWAAVDRLLLKLTDQFSPETRTGFLIRQFRGLLADLGLEHFAGFHPADLQQVPKALATLSRVDRTADRFFRHVEPALAALWEGVSPVQSSGADDLLAGYVYRDFAGDRFGPGGFLRIALHLEQQDLQISFWVTQEAGENHRRLWQALTDQGEWLDRLRELEHDPLLWLWSPQQEHQIPLAELTPASLRTLDWDRYQAGLQRHHPLALLTSEGAVQQVVSLAEQLVRRLDPILTPVLH